MRYRPRSESLLLRRRRRSLRSVRPPRVIDRVIDFLEQYKVIFEVGAATLLALMAIIVSSAQMFSAQDQTELLKLQTHIAEAQALPQFAIRRRLSNNEDVVTVENRGGLFRMVRTEVYDALVVEIVREKRRRFSYLPLSGYHDRASDDIFSALPSIELKPLLGKRMALTRFAQQLERYRYTRSSAWRRDSMTFKSSGLVVLMRIEYSDVLKRNHALWFATVDDFKRVGDIPVIPIDADLVEDVFDEFDAGDAVNINRTFTNAFVCEVGRKILDREFGIFDMLWLELK